MNTLKRIVFVATVMMLLDGLWLGIIANDFYLKNLKHLVRGDGSHFDVNYPAAAVVYLFMVMAFLIFIYPEIKTLSLKMAAARAAALGVALYGVYDFTNLATLNNWPLSVALADILWGTTLYVITTLSCRWAIDKNLII